MSTDVLADRYGTTSPARRRLLIVAVATLIAVSAGWLGWTIWEQARPAAASSNLTFTIVDDNTATATMQVELRDTDVVATCLVKAYAEDHSLVGQVTFTPAASGRVTQEISTDRRATSVEREGCTAPGQPRPR